MNKQVNRLPMKKKLKICSRGHKFYKSSDCPSCPECWSGYYRKKSQSDFPENLSAPALRALFNAEITQLKELSRFTEKEVLQFHGMGPTGVRQLKAALAQRNLAFLKKVPKI